MPETIERLRKLAENVQYSANWRESVAELATVIADELQALAPAVKPEDQTGN